MKNNQFDTGFVLDMAGLERLRAGVKTGKDGESQGLRAAAEQFEAIFTQMMFKSMREANSAFESDLMSSRNTKFFEQMHDEQMASELSRTNSLGLADLIVEQLGAHLSGEEAASHEAQTILSPSDTEKLLHPEQPDRSVHNEADSRQTPDTVKTSLLVETNQLPVTDSNMPVSERGNVLPPYRAVSQPVDVSATSEMPALPPRKPTSFTSPDEFVQAMKPYAMRAGRALGVDPGVLIAQAALETGWGKKVLRNAAGDSYNLFNIKADSRWGGKKLTTQTLEFHQGIPVQERASFRSYNSYQDSFSDYVRFLQDNPRYETALNYRTQPERFVREIHKAGYATDPEYSKKVLRVLDQVNEMMEK
ncbi:flagellar assembly peptidoglycan hydrolase FlgJ [Photobacterium sp. GSS17]|uniref:flagellar assembly peptidoglycan hydrolase FlgJ n=1 Tax=Photobacterium TaxID=657 RepID=UPI0023627C7C|nr:flagellar assembly peptidoglycan hydrolase FlgJ [Photobacterium sp. GSS17]